MGDEAYRLVELEDGRWALWHGVLVEGGRWAAELRPPRSVTRITVRGRRPSFEDE